MKYLKELSQLYTFTINEASKIIGNIPATKKYIKSMVTSGYIHKIRKNLYTCLDLSSNDDYADRFQIASTINKNSYVAYHSAFEFYGFYNHVYNRMQVATDKKFTPFDYDGYSYDCYLNDIDIQIETIKHSRVTTIERTIIDSINLLGKVMDAEELVKCLDLISFVDESRLIEMLKAYDKEVLYRKVGYILSFYKEEFRLSDSFFDLCMKKGVISNNGSLMNHDKSSLVYDSKWGLYVFPNIRHISYKGGDIEF